MERSRPSKDVFHVDILVVSKLPVPVTIPFAVPRWSANAGARIREDVAA